MTRLLVVKAVRELLRSASQFAAAGVVVMLGVGAYVGLMSSYRNLSASYNAYYQRCNLADFHVEFDFGTARLADRVLRLPGVLKAHGRLVIDVPLETGGAGHKRVTCRVISLPDRPQERVDDVILLAGRRPLVGRRELLLEKRFAHFFGYRPGQHVTLLIKGQELTYTVCGLAVSPEYIYPIASKEYLIASPSTFGVAFMLRREAENAFQAWGLINNLAVTCQPGERDAVMAEVGRLLKPYGTKDPEPREQQPSYYLLNADLQGYRPTAIFFPSFLLLAAALTMYTILRRLIESQRPVVGFLRASGFTRAQVVLHYTSFPVALGLAAGSVGVGLGQLLAVGITHLYLHTLNIPLGATPMHWPVALAGAGLGVGACLIGGAGPSLGAAHLRPADALRDAPLAAGRRLPLERIVPFLSRAGALVKMPLRNLARRPSRTFWALIGVAAAAAMIIMSNCWADATDDLVNTYLNVMRRFDLQVGFQAPQTSHQAFRPSNWPGVQRAEGTLGVPVRIMRGDRRVDTTLVGLQPDARLMDLRGLDGRRLALRRGVVLASRLLHKKLHAAPGDVVNLQYAFATKYRRGEMQAVLGPRLRLPVGQSLYMNIADVRRAFRDALELPPGGINSILIKTVPGALAWVHARCYDLPLAGAVSSELETRRDLDEQLAFINMFIAVMLAFGMLLATSVVYATVSVTVLERRRELAALRAEGMSMRCITALVTLENLIVWLMGCVVGVPIGIKFALIMQASYVTDIMEYRAVLYPRTPLMAVTATLLAVLLSQWPALRYVRGLNLAQVLRYRE